MDETRLLIVEDNWEVRELLKVIFVQNGFQVFDLERGRDAVDFCEDHPPDVMVLDLTLPDMDGLEVCRRVKAFPQMSGVPIIMCTARAHVSERVKGLDSGADDYLTKPFDPSELVARVKVLLRRSGQPVKETRNAVQSGDLKLDPRNYRAAFQGKLIEEITPKEFDILYLLIEQSPKPVGRSDISKSVLGREHSEESRGIDMHIAQIRKKLPPSCSERILTISGKGYLWSK